MKVKNKIDQHCKQLRLSALGGQVQHLADAAAAEGITVTWSLQVGSWKLK